MKNGGFYRFTMENPENKWMIILGVALFQETATCHRTVDRNPAAVDGKHPMRLLIGFQPSVWWCRILQPSTV